MVRKIIFFEEHFMVFYQNEKVKGKILYVFEVIKQVERVPNKFLEHISETDGLYEIRVEYQSNIYSIFTKRPKKHRNPKSRRRSG